MTVLTRNSARKKRPRNSSLEKTPEKLSVINDKVQANGRRRSENGSKQAKIFRSSNSTHEKTPQKSVTPKKMPQANGGRKSVNKIRDEKPFKSTRPKNKKGTVIDVANVGFLKWEISGIRGAAVSPNGELVVVVRSSGCMELLQKCVGWLATSVVRWNVADESTGFSAITFDRTGEYLIVGRLNGTLDIYSVSSEGMMHHVSVKPGGGSVLSLAVRPDGPFEVAVGCEDGTVRFVSVDDQFLSLDTINPATYDLSQDPSHFVTYRGQIFGGMCLSLSWKSVVPDDAGLIVCGDSQGGLRWISGSTKEIIGRCKVPKNRAECHIWTVQIVAKGSQVICGDSFGFVSVWCSKSFTKLEENRIEGLRGDIWASGVVSSSDGSETCLLGAASGSVASISSLLSDNGIVSWMPNRGRVVHSHDVRSIGILPEVGFFTASLDSRLCFFDGYVPDVKKAKFVLPHHGAECQMPYQFLPELNVALARQGNEVQFWRISSQQDDVPKFLLRLERPDKFGAIVSYAVSEDGSMVAISNVDHFAIYKLSVDVDSDENLVGYREVEPFPLSPDIGKEFSGSEHLSFSGDILVGIAKDRQSVVVLDEGDLKRFPKEMIGSEARMLTCLSCSSSCSVAVSDSQSNVFVGRLREARGKQNSRFLRAANFPEGFGVACVEFSRAGNTLAVSLWDSRVAVIALQGGTSKVALMMPFPSLPTSLCFASSEKCLLLSGPGFCYFTSWAFIPDTNRADKIAHLPKNIDVVSRDSAVIASGSLSRDKFCVLQRTWELEVGQLPSVLVKKHYGL